MFKEFFGCCEIFFVGGSVFLVVCIFVGLFVDRRVFWVLVNMRSFLAFREGFLDFVF